MKNFLMVFVCLFFCGCAIHAGDMGVLKKYGFNIDVSDTYDAGIYGKNKIKLVKSEYVEERNFKVNETQMVGKGGSVLNKKIYRKDYYAKDEVIANKDVVLQSASVPQKIYKNKAYAIVGVVNIDGKEFRLVKSDLDGFVFLIENDGSILNKMGRLKNEKLTLMPTEYVVFPDDVKFNEVTKSSTIQSKPVKGFDIKYDGIKAGRMWFTYLDYEGSNDKGKFQEISFPAKAGLIEINGVGIRVSNVDDNKIEYVIVKY